MIRALDPLFSLQGRRFIVCFLKRLGLGKIVPEEGGLLSFQMGGYPRKSWEIIRKEM